MSVFVHVVVECPIMKYYPQSVAVAKNYASSQQGITEILGKLLQFFETLTKPYKQKTVLLEE